MTIVCTQKTRLLGFHNLFIPSIFASAVFALQSYPTHQKDLYAHSHVRLDVFLNKFTLDLSSPPQKNQSKIAILPKFSRTQNKMAFSLNSS